MSQLLGSKRGSRDHGSALRRTQAESREASHAAETEAIGDNFLATAGLDLSTALSRADGATRARAITRLQQTHGNAYVQRVAADRHGAPSPSGEPGLAVQREGEEDKFKLSALPPELMLPMGPLSLSADTSKAELGYAGGPFSATTGYEYGGDIYAGAKYGDFSAKLGLNPSDEKLSLSGGYGGVNLGLSATEKSFSGGLSYGSPLLPMPGDLSSTVYKGEAGAMGMLGALPGAMNDPLGTYEAQKPNFDATKGAIDTLSGVGATPTAPWGAGIQGSWTPEQWGVMAGLRANF